LQERSRFLLLAALLALAASGFLSLAAQSTRFPYALDYGDAMILDEAWLIAQGQNIYPPSPASPPYLIPSYPPLFMAIQAPMTRWFGLSFWYGRLIAELSAIATAVCAGLVASRFAGRRAGVLAALAVIAVPFFNRWAHTVRVDMLAVACAWGAVAALVS
jgi:4-amino-4-deoxy-L-arabinose transferase-like glycosyltransferase